VSKSYFAAQKMQKFTQYEKAMVSIARSEREK